MNSSDRGSIGMEDSLSVLVVNDGVSMRESIRHALLLDGYKVETAGSVKELLAFQNVTQFLAIILDRQVPDLDTCEIVVELNKRGPAVAVLIVAGYAETNPKIPAIQLGIDNYLVRLVEPETLRAQLAALAELYRLKRQIPVTQQKLVQSERLAAIGQMVTGLAHESRNALQRARSCLDLLELDLQGQSEPLDMAHRIREALGDLQRTYEEVRNYAAPIALTLKQVDCLPILHRVIQGLREDFPSSKHRLMVHNPTPRIVLQADETRLSQVFRNVLNNAMAASDIDSTIEVSFHRRIIEGRNILEISFQDSGDGMDESTLSQLFEPFYTTKQSGTGLGMALCKRIVESHGGKIFASSVKGNGSTIAIMLPSTPASSQWGTEQG